jgi:hypothetical protein
VTLAAIAGRIAVIGVTIAPAGGRTIAEAIDVIDPTTVARTAAMTRVVTGAATPAAIAEMTVAIGVTIARVAGRMIAVDTGEMIGAINVTNVAATGGTIAVINVTNVAATGGTIAAINVTTAAATAAMTRAATAAMNADPLGTTAPAIEEGTGATIVHNGRSTGPGRHATASNVTTGRVIRSNATRSTATTRPVTVGPRTARRFPTTSRPTNWTQSSARTYAASRGRSPSGSLATS